MIIRENLKKIILVSFISITAALFAACGKQVDEGLESYKASMTEFYDKLTYLDNSINIIEPESETAKEELLDYLDQMNDAYKKMAAVEIPDQFSGISDIAVEAADYMEKANEFYHMAYDNDFDADSEMLAAQYYQRANSRVIVMLQVLHGQVPEGEGITVETENTYEFSTIDDESSEESTSEAQTESTADEGE